MNSAEDHEKAAEISTNTPPHLCEKAGAEQAPTSATNLPSSPKQPEQITGRKGALGMASVSGRIKCLGSSPAGARRSPIGEGDQAKDGMDSLQWIQALELQVVGACRSDERLRPSLRWNVSCFGSDGRLLAHLGQHFKARELALLAKCLCTPVVSLRVGKVSRHGRYLHPTSARGYLNLMLLPCSEMRLAFADDAGTVQRVAVTIPGLESGGILIEELKEDASQRTFVLKDRSGKITNYFWQSEKLKSTGDELIVKIRTMLKRRPTLAHFTGIDEGRLDSFANYLRTAIFSKLASSNSSPTPNLAPNSSPKPELDPSSQHLNLSQFNHTSSFASSMAKLRRCVQEIDSSLCPNSTLRVLARTLPATAQLIESLKRLRKCLHSLMSSKRTSSIIVDNIRLYKKVPPFKNRRLQLLHHVTSPELTVMYRNPGPTLDHNLLGPALALVNYQHYQCPPATKRISKLQKRFVYTKWSFFGEFFIQVVSQILAMVFSHLPNEMVYTHNLYVLPFANLQHVGDNSLLHLGRQRRRANLWGYQNELHRLLPMPSRNHVENGPGDIPSAGSGLRRLGDDEDRKKSSGESCRRCAASASLGNLVLVTFYAQETGPGLRVVTAEITSGNTFYIVVSVANILVYIDTTNCSSFS